MTQHNFITETRCKTLLLGKRILYFPACPSTNTLIANLLHQEKLEEGCVVITDNQYQGRGQRGNTWCSEPYKNLTFSFVLYPSFLETKQNFNLTIMTSLAIYASLAMYLPKDLFIKWPNDVYYQNKKLGGILIENKVEEDKIKASIIGIGLSINQSAFPFATATSLALACQQTFNLPLLLTQLLEALEYYYLQLQSHGIGSLKKDYQTLLYWLDSLHFFKEREETFQGRIRGVDELGQLMIEQEDGSIKPYGFKEISFVQ